MSTYIRGVNLSKKWLKVIIFTILAVVCATAITLGVVLSQKDNFVVTPTPQVTYVGLNENEIKYLNDLIQDLKQYYNDDYGLSQYLGEQEKEVERPILYFVSKNKILSKIVNLLCCIFDKSRLNKDLADLVSTLVSLSRIVNSK